MAGGKRILIADDDPDIVGLLTAYFIKCGHEVTVAVNGKEALQKAENARFDMLLLDVMMPYIDGYHVASEITFRFGADAPKILIMTSRDVFSEKGIAFLSGAGDVIQKPFDVKTLDAKVKALLE